jgi:tetratricopeptide (TPR) repeat protein
MKKYLIFILPLFVLVNARAANYNRVLVAQYLEEQSYAALLELENTVPVVDRDIYFFNALGFSAFQMSLWSRSESYYLGSLQLDSLNLQANLYLGAIKKQQRKFKDALVFYKRLSSLKPEQARFFKHIADCFSSLKQDDSAIVYLSKAYSLSPNDLNIAYSYADVLYTKKLYEQTDKVVNASLQIDATNISILNLAIRSAYFQKKYKEVMVFVDQLSASDIGESALTPMMFGMFAALQLKDYNKSVFYSNYLMRNGCESEQVCYYTAKAYAGLKDYHRSNEFLSRCLELAVAVNAEAYYTQMAENFEALKLYAKAQKNYDTARFFSGNNQILYRKAIAFEAASESEKAVKAYKEFIKLARMEDSAMVNFAKKRVVALQ